MALEFLLGCFGHRLEHLSVGSHKLTLICLWTLKPLLAIFIGCAAFFARPLYHLVHAHPELHQPPYNTHVLRSQELVYFGGLTAFAWTFVSFATLFKWQQAWILLHGIIDFGFAIVLSVAAGMQSGYLPARMKTCKSSEKWQISGDRPSFFSAAASFDSRHSSDGICRQFLTEWALLVVAVFIYMLISYIGIFFDERGRSVLHPGRPPLMLSYAIFVPPAVIVILTYEAVSPKIAYAYHYLLALTQRLRKFKPVEIEMAKPYVPKEEWVNLSNPKLQHILCIEHVLLNIVSNMHYEDVINLSLTSKSVREAVFPSSDLEYRIPKLRRACCDQITKRVCLYCNKSVCRLCVRYRGLPKVAGQSHVDCKPQCKKCYHSLFTSGDSPRRCNCRKPSMKHTETQDVCPTCDQRETAAMQKARAKRFKKQIREAALGIGLPDGEVPRCSKCNEELGSGPRWWFCTMCMRECRDSLHPGWIKLNNEKDIEKAEPEGLEAERMEEERTWWKQLTRSLKR